MLLGFVLGTHIGAWRHFVPQVINRYYFVLNETNGGYFFCLHACAVLLFVTLCCRFEIRSICGKVMEKLTYLYNKKHASVHTWNTRQCTNASTSIADTHISTVYTRFIAHFHKDEHIINGMDYETRNRLIAILKT